MSFYELPKNWEIRKLGEVCEIVGGGTPSRANKSFFGGNILWLTPTEIDKVVVKTIFDSREKITELGLQKSSAKIIPAGSVLLSSRATIGNVAIAGTEFTTNQGFASFICPARLYNKYLAYWLKCIKKTLNDNAKGTTFKEISKSEIKNLTFPLPPLAEQERIVAKIEELFSELDAGTESLKRARQQLKIYRQAVLKWTFEERKENYKHYLLKDISEKIQIGPFGSQLHREDYIENGIPLINPTHIKAGKIVADSSYTITVEKRDSLQNYILQNGDVIMGRRGEMARCGLVTEKENGWFCGTGSLYFRPNSKLVDSTFLHNYLTSDPVKKYLEENAGGTTMANLNGKIVKNIPIFLPSIAEQQRIVQEIESRLSVCDKLEETIHTNLKQAEALRQSILKKAFEGKLVKPKAIEKPKRTAFYQMQTLGLIVNRSKQNRIRHGEMTLAKYAFLADKIYGVPIYDCYERWHLGPYPTDIKKTVNNKEYFKTENHSIRVLNEEKLFKYHNEYKEQIENAVDELANIFSSFEAKDRSHKTELLATVCKVIEDIQTTKIEAVRQSMAEWKIELKDNKFKNKAEKFDEAKTAKCVAFIVKNGWDKKLIK